MSRRMNRYRLAATLAAAWFVATGGATTAAPVAAVGFDRVVEDWELVIEQPDLVAEGPQITTTMSPSGDIADLSVVLNLNYRSIPKYRAGGLEVAAYRDERVLGSTTQHEARLRYWWEPIRWSQSMRLTGGEVSFEIIDGASTSWGKFGQGSGANLGLRVASEVATLAAYSPKFSVEHSGVGWQGNRVSSMRLVRVRYYLGEQLVAVDQTAREIEIDR